MSNKKFNPEKIELLNNLERLKEIPPGYIWERLEIDDPKVLVDIGAGTGFYSLEFLKFLNKGTVYACDISDIMITWIEENICPKNPDVVPLMMRENEIPLENNIADIAFMINLHHELEDPGLLLKEILRILNEKGVLFIVDWKKEEMKEGPPLHIKYLPGRVEEQLKKAGFKRVKIFNELPKHFLVVAWRV